jgi:xanthine dehydrogenase molybdopterin-binding subunit B
LGNFGIPTGGLGTVEQTNEEDAVVKWDDDGRKRLHQPCLKKVPVSEHRPVQKNVQFSHRKMFTI